MDLKWPWKEFPQDIHTWGVCKEDFEKALLLLEQSLMIGMVVDKEEHKKNVFEFLDKVKKPVEPKETITIEEFKNLIPNDSPDRKQASGRFAINGEVHKKQCEDLKVGDKVFFFDIEYLEESGVDVDITIVQAKLVE